MRGYIPSFPSSLLDTFDQVRIGYKNVLGECDRTVQVTVPGPLTVEEMNKQISCYFFSLEKIKGLDTPMRCNRLIGDDFRQCKTVCYHNKFENLLCVTSETHENTINDNFTITVDLTEY